MPRNLFIRKEVPGQRSGDRLVFEGCDRWRRQCSGLERDSLEFPELMPLGERLLGEQMGSLWKASADDDVADGVTYDLDKIGFDPCDRGGPPSIPEWPVFGLVHASPGSPF